jgi:nickel-dependent lactate racemase
MAVYRIPYGKDYLDVDINERNLLFYASPVKMSENPDQVRVIEKSLDEPVGTRRLEELVSPTMKISVMIDDITRPTPKKMLLPAVLKRLEKAGVPRGNIKIVIGLGTHRQMTDEEIEIHIGKNNIKGYEFVNIDYKDESAFVNLGKSDNGTPIEVYKEVVETDFKIAIGNIVPHIAAGWGGGAKMIQPGVCSERTTEVTHLMACTLQPVLEVCGNADNETRREMEKIAGRVGLDYIVNTVLDENRNILGVFCGHYIKAHRAGVELAEKLMCPEIPAQADILIASAYPSDIDFWQGCKPYIYAQYGVKTSGVLIFVIDGCEGFCGNAPQHEDTLRKWSLVSFEEQKAAVAKGEIKDIVGINVPLFHSTVRHRTTTICVSRGFTKEDAECLGFIYAGSIEKALDMAYDLKGKDAKVGIIPYCGETLVRLKKP